MARSTVFRRRLIVVTVLALAGLLVVLLPRGDQPVVRLAQAARDTGSAGVVVFFLAYVVSTVALVPGSVLTLAAGFAYGPLWGLNVLNYALSLSKVRLGTYVVASFLGMLPGTALYVYLGALAPAAAELTSSASGAGTAQHVLYVGGLGATVAVAVIATRAARRALASELPDTG